MIRKKSPNTTDWYGSTRVSCWKINILQTQHLNKVGWSHYIFFTACFERRTPFLSKWRQSSSSCCSSTSGWKWRYVSLWLQCSPIQTLVKLHTSCSAAYITCGFEHFIFIHIYSNFAFFPLKFIKACYLMLKGNNLKLTTFIVTQN